MLGCQREDLQVSARKREEGDAFGYGPYKDVAGISVKWGRECVQGITLGKPIAQDPELKIPPYQMLLPFGFASYENPTGDRFRSMEPEDNPDV